MITKIQKIRSIGNFNDYDASGDVTLKKFSLIYAENGVGKTTLATILKSLSLCDERLLLNRRRIDSTKDPLVEIRLEDGTLAKFDSGRWNKRVADLEVFDSIFVADNVYSGMNITLDNRRSFTSVH